MGRAVQPPAPVTKILTARPTSACEAVHANIIPRYRGCSAVHPNLYSRSAWKVNSQKLNFRFMEFSEGRRVDETPTRPGLCPSLRRANPVVA